MKLTFAGARVNAGFSQDEAVKSLGITKACLSLIERYESTPRTTTFIRMCNLYNVDPKELEWEDLIDKIKNQKKKKKKK